MNISQMFLQRRLSRISHATIVAWKTLPLMFIHVAVIMALLIKTSPADVTMIAELSRVNLHVALKDVFIRELLVTQITWI